MALSINYHRSRPLTFLPSLRDQHWKEFLEENKGGHKRAAEPGTPLKPVYIHGERQTTLGRCWARFLTWLVPPLLGMIYDISTGMVYDLDVSQGPPGYKGDPSKCKRNLITALRHGNANPSQVDGC